MAHSRWPWLALVIVLTPLVSGAQDDPPARRSLQLEDYYRIDNAAQPAISPDGRWVAFTRRWTAEEENARRSDIWLAPSDGSAEPRRLTHDAFDSDSPVFSPDGKLLAFRSSRPMTRLSRARQQAVSENSPQQPSIWFLRMDAPGEAFRIPGIDNLPVYSPDGRWVAFTKRTPPENADPQAEPSDLEKKLEERFQGRIFDWMQYRFDRRGYLPDPEDPRASPPRELYVVPAQGGEARQLTRFGFDVTGFSWSPDSKKLAVTADADQRDEWVYERADLWLVDLAGEVERLTDDGFHRSSPAFSPDGSGVAFRQVKGLSLVIAARERGAPQDLAVLELANRQTRNLTERWNLRPGAPVWSPDGAGVFFSAGIGGNRHLFRVPAAGRGEVEQVTFGSRQLGGFSFSADFQQMAYTVDTPTSPAEVHVARASLPVIPETPVSSEGPVARASLPVIPDAQQEIRLSRVGDPLLRQVELREPQRIRYPSKDGTLIEGWVLLPGGEGPHPLILAIHGGPHGAYGNRLSFAFQLWAAHGFAVLYTNPRGSSGYGEDFLYATWGGGWGNLDSEDVMAGVDYVLKNHPIDEGRMGVTGYSYGGFLTNWLITRTPRFAAAVSGAGISNWISDYGTADIPRTKESEFYGPPWEEESGALLERQSPIRYAGAVRTPTLFIHGEDDFRVPIEQAEQMYMALQKLKVPAKFIRYPATAHGGWTPWNTVHRHYHELKWFQQYLAR